MTAWPSRVSTMAFLIALSLSRARATAVLRVPLSGPAPGRARRASARAAFLTPISSGRGAFSERSADRSPRAISPELPRRRRFAGPIMMASDDDDSSADMGGKALDSEWDIGALKKETARLVLRSHKKIGKASSRLEAARLTAEELATDPNATLRQLEACPNVDALQAELDELRSRLAGLNDLEEMVRKVKKKRVVLPETAAALALELGVNDAPPNRPERGPKKPKGPGSVPARLPYRKYFAADGTEIRVGKQAEDNDELSLDPQHRDGADWWMHASGCPGSHVVIRCPDQSVNEEVVMDAAALAARQSKCKGNMIKVSMVRCREVSKPHGAKAGLVQLNGRVRTVPVSMKEAESRLQRLDQTVVIN